MSQTKLIFSRKGFDSKFGGSPSLILPESGETLSFPIPNEMDKISYEDIKFQGKSYAQIFSELGFTPGVSNKSIATCHLDPDLRADSLKRKSGWRPAFGQAGAALSHLENEKVSKGDIFVFFGWYRFAEAVGGKYSYLRKMPEEFKDYRKDLHVCYGYMEVDQIIDVKKDAVPDWLKYHSHAFCENGSKIYIGKERLSGSPSKSGAGSIPFSKKSILTAPGMSRSRWNLPELFRGANITYHDQQKSWKEDYFQSANIGQEFVVRDATSEMVDWFISLLDGGSSEKLAA